MVINKRDLSFVSQAEIPRCWHVAGLGLYMVAALFTQRMGLLASFTAGILVLPAPHLCLSVKKESDSVNILLKR